MILRNEEESDVEAIAEVTIAPFKSLPIGNHTDQYVVSALRAADALAVSLVAEVHCQVIGHVAFSPVTISDGSQGWYGVGPVSVLPEMQRQGVGKSLMNEGLRLLREPGVKGCVLVGDPNYYSRFGFRNLPDLVLEGIPQLYFLALPFGDNKARGVVVFHEGFAATS